MPFEHNFYGTIVQKSHNYHYKALLVNFSALRPVDFRPDWVPVSVNGLNPTLLAMIDEFLDVKYVK